MKLIKIRASAAILSPVVLLAVVINETSYSDGVVFEQCFAMAIGLYYLVFFVGILKLMLYLARLRFGEIIDITKNMFKLGFRK